MKALADIIVDLFTGNAFVMSFLIVGVIVLIANALSKHIGVPVVQLVTKEKETKRQAKLNRVERLKNLKGCFKASSKKEIEGKTILLIDDVLTTGATSESVAEVLKNKGAKAVYLLTVASVASKEGY